MIDSVNVVGTVALTDACFRRNIPCTVYATGCIYEVRKRGFVNVSMTQIILLAVARDSPRRMSRISVVVSTATQR